MRSRCKECACTGCLCSSDMRLALQAGTACGWSHSMFGCLPDAVVTSVQRVLRWFLRAIGCRVQSAAREPVHLTAADALWYKALLSTSHVLACAT